MIFRDDMFVITCPARSGSSMLVSLLNSHPDICAYGELFGPRRLTGLRGAYRERAQASPDFVPRLQAWRDREPVAFLYKVATDAQGCKVVGFKIKHEQLAIPALSSVRDAIARDVDFKIIRLRRRNLLRRHVSHEIAKATRTIRVPSEGPSPPLAKVRLDAQECLDNFKRYERWDDEVERSWADHRSLVVCYEDLLESTDELERVQAFLGVAPHELTTRTRKILSDDLRELVTNYDELHDFFAETEYAAFFEATPDR